MYKLIIADDEPLVCVGVQSMLDWEALGVEIVGIARNGQKAAELIEENKPDIVITDIKMPIKNGLQLAQESKDKYGEVPAFIILTSYEDFEYARQAIQAQTLDYLVKLELDEKTLSKAIRNAIAAVDKQRRMHPGQQVLVRSNMQALREKFFIRLFNNLFDSEENYQVQRRDLDIDQKSAAYAVVTCSVMQNDECSGSDKPFSLYSSVMQLVRETIYRYLACYVIPLDMWHFSIVFCLDETAISSDYKALIREALIQTSDLLYRYMSVSLRSIVGKTVDDLRRLDISYRQSQHCCRQVGDSTVSFYDDYSESTSDYIISLQTLRQSISKAFEEMDMAALNKSFTSLADIFVSHPDDLLNAMDTACNILYMAISLLPDGEAMVEQIFADSSESYRSLYRLRDVDSISTWLLRLRDGCSDLIQSRRQSYKERIIINIKNYIQENLDKRLTLHEVAAVFNFNPNYLSQLFSKYAGESFVEYYTSARIAAAKDMLAKGEGRNYEIAEKLGFESSFYFSKVFKKVEGISPREYLQKLEQEADSSVEVTEY